VRRVAPLVTLAVLLALAAPAGAQLSSQSSWPQVAHDAGLTKRTGVTGSQTGTPAPGFPAPKRFGNAPGFSLAGPPAIYVDGNLIAGMNPDLAPASDPVSQLVFVNAAGVPFPGAARVLFSDTGPFTVTAGLTAATPAVSSSGLMFAASTGGHLWTVPPSGPATPTIALPPATSGVGSPTIAADGTLYFTAGVASATRSTANKTLYGVNPSTGSISLAVPTTSVDAEIALDGAGNVYLTQRGRLRSVTAGGSTRWTFTPPGRLRVVGPPMIYRGTAYVIVGRPSGSFPGPSYEDAALVAVSATSGKRSWTSPLHDDVVKTTDNNAPGAQNGPALGARGTVLGLTKNRLTAVSPSSGRKVWTYTLPTDLSAQLSPMVDSSGDTYILAKSVARAGRGAVVAVNAKGHELWRKPIHTQADTDIFTFNLTGDTIGADGTIYISAIDGVIWAFRDPS
jgi:outer membrane protein assembly factor BamB